MDSERRSDRDRQAVVPRRLALVIGSLEAGGAERVMVNLANGLARAGHDVHLVVGTASGPFAAGLAADVHLYDLGHRRFAFALPALWRALARIRPDAVVSSLLPANVLCVAAWDLSLHRLPAPVLWEHTVLSRYFRIDPTSRRWHRPVARWAYRRARRIVAVSGAARADVIELFGLRPARVVAVDNPVITPELLAAARVDVPLPWGDDEGPVVVWVGRLEPIKDPLAALDALHALRARVPARLLVLGEGSLASAFDERVDRLGLGVAVHRAGFVGDPMPWIRRADVLLSTSQVEGLPTVFVEALAVGTPVVTTASSPTHGSVLGDDSGPNRIVASGDPQALADALATVLSKGRSTNGSLLGDRFSVERAVADFERIMHLDR